MTQPVAALTPDQASDVVVMYGGLTATDIAGKLTLRRRRGGISMAIGWLSMLAILSAFAGVIHLHPYADFVTSLPARTPPGFRWPEFLGTDSIGRSQLSRLIYGVRQSLEVGLSAALFATLIGTSIGVTAGYFRGRTDRYISFLLDCLLAFPALVLLLAIVAIGSSSTTTVTLGLAIIGVPVFSRIVRAQTFALREREFVLAARAMGAKTFRIILREIVPNVLPAVTSIIFLFMSAAIVAEGSLAFIGVGIPPPNPSLGGMINDGIPYLSTQPYLVFLPAAVLFLTVLALRTVGDRLGARYIKGSAS